MNLRSLVVLPLFVVVTACSPGTPGPMPSPVASVPPGESASPGAAITLRQAPADLGCDAIGVDYGSVTFRIDADAAEQVSAITDKGVQLLTYWAPGFQPGSAAERVIRDPTGEVVVADGDQLVVARAAPTRLNGYFVCLSPSALYVLAAGHPAAVSEGQ